MTKKKENRPAGKQGGAGISATAKENKATPILSAHPELKERLYGYAVLVEDRNGRFRRRLFLTIAPAERAVNRAHARGVAAEAFLIEFHPVRGENS